MLRPRTPTHELPLHQQDDAELLQSSVQGDREAFAALWAKYHHTVLHAVRPLAKSDTEDVVAEAYTEIWHQLQRGSRPPEHFKNYLITVSKNVASRQYRAKQHTVTGLELETLAEQPITPASSVFIERRDERRRVIAAFRSLPLRWQQTLWLTTVEKRPRKEIAKTLGIGVNAVSAIAVRAKEGLRIAWLEQHLPPPEHVDHAHIASVLPKYIRKALRTQNFDRVTQHLASCASCQHIHQHLLREDRRLRNKRGGALLLAALTTAGSTVKPGIPAVAAAARLPQSGLIEKIQGLITHGGTSLGSAVSAGSAATVATITTAVTLGVVGLGVVVGAALNSGTVENEEVVSGDKTPHAPSGLSSTNPVAPAPGTATSAATATETSTETSVEDDTETGTAAVTEIETVDSTARELPPSTLVDSPAGSPPSATSVTRTVAEIGHGSDEGQPAEPSEPAELTEPTEPVGTPAEYFPFNVLTEVHPSTGIPPIIHGTADPSSHIILEVGAHALPIESDEHGHWVVDIAELNLPAGSYTAHLTHGPGGETATIPLELWHPTVHNLGDGQSYEIHGLPNSVVCLGTPSHPRTEFMLNDAGVLPLWFANPHWQGHITLRYCDGERYGPTYVFDKGPPQIPMVL